ncbi:MAG: flagellar hook-basal body complex protein FliE [Spirochaetaceae bacterium]|jgi:flagellar hook-basal body complex protein FliE|nr:flagellar hook-basal body complex protein FliE [Spirochaetaceae bacterium]
MSIGVPQLVGVDAIPLRVTHPKHLLPSGIPSGEALASLGDATGAAAMLPSGNFEDAMLRALDGVSGDQQRASDLIQRAITEPGSVDVHDITIAQAKASMSLNISRTVLNRLVQGWKDLINTR